MTRSQYVVLAIFVGLILFCAALAIVGNSLNPYSGTKITDVAAEGLKISVSALVGALSALLTTKG
jgi:hypothetical protein